jgi:hypothetical protein
MPRLIPRSEHYFSIINPFMTRRRLPSVAALLNTVQNKASRPDKRAKNEEANHQEGN